MQKALDSNCNCLALRKAARQVTQLYDAALAETGLRSTQYSLLHTLDRLGPSSQQALADELVMDRSSLGHSLRPLERDRLVVLAVDPNDRRSRRLTLTARGKTKLAECRRCWQRVQDDFEARYGAAKAKDLRTLLSEAVESATD